MGLGYKLGRAARAIWEGPFAVGPLIQPVSLGAALLRVLEVMWKFGIALLTAGAVALALAAVWVPIDRALNPSLTSQLVGEAHFDPASCGKDLPILVILRNRSESVLASAQIDLRIKQSGRSTNLNKEPSLDWDAIVQPGKANALCYGFPSDIAVDPKTLTYSVDIWSPTAQN